MACPGIMYGRVERVSNVVIHLSLRVRVIQGLCYCCANVHTHTHTQSGGIPLSASDRMVDTVPCPVLNLVTAVFKSVSDGGAGSAHYPKKQ